LKNKFSIMYMGMEVEFDFEVPPVEEFSKRICHQVASNIERSSREERVQRKKRELRERIKMQIVTSPYTLTPRQAMVDSNRRDSMTLPLERRSFTPFQKVPFRNQTVADSRPRHSYFDAESLRSKSQAVTTATTNEPQDIDVRLSYLSTSTTKIESQTYASSKESFSSNSSFSAICSPPQRSLSPTLGALKSSKSMFDKDDGEDDRSVTSTLQSMKSDAFVTATEKEQHQIDSDTEKIREKITKEDFWNAIPEGSEYIQAEFFWLVDYRGTDKTFDSDAFTFAGTRFRLTFSPNNLSPPEKSSGYSLLLALAQSHGRAYVACEFSVHGLLRPTFRRKCSRNLHFTPRSSVYRGYKHFMGPELLSYLEKGTFTFSVMMKTYIGPKGELLGLSDPLGGIIRAPRSVGKNKNDVENNTLNNNNIERERVIEKEREMEREREGENGGGDDNDDNDSEIVSHSCEGEGEEECRMDEIYPEPRENNYFYSDSNSLRQNRNRSLNMSQNRNGGIMGTGSGINRNCGPGSGPGSGHSVGRGSGRSGGNSTGRNQNQSHSLNLSHSHSYFNHNCLNDQQNKNKEKLHTTYMNTNTNSSSHTHIHTHTNTHHNSNSSSVASSSTTCFSGLPSPSGDVRGTSRRRYFSDTVNSISFDGRNIQ
jgi:hypothetical protein